MMVLGPMHFYRYELADVPSPCVVIQAFQPKLGIRLPANLPVLINAGHVHSAAERIKLREWAHMFVTLATFRRREYAKVYIGWCDGVELFDIDAYKSKVD